MVTYRDVSAVDARYAVVTGNGWVDYFSADGVWKRVSNPLWQGFDDKGNKFRIGVDEEKITRYDWQEPSLPAEEAVANFQSEEEALSVLQGSVNKGACDGEEYIIYKITYEPVKRLRVKINTILEEI